MAVIPLMLASAVATNGVAVTNIEITVVGSPVAQAEYATPDGAEVVEIAPAQLGRLTAQDLPTALRHVPGVAVSRYSPIGAYGGAQGGSVYVRGTGESRPGGSLAVFQDGVPAMGSFFAHPLLDLNPIDFAESVQVTKTPRPRAVPNAFTALDLATWRWRDEGWGGEADAAFGRFSTYVGSVRAGAKECAFDAAAGAAARRSEGKRDHSAARLENAFVRAGAEMGEAEYLTFIYRRAESEVEDPGPKGTPTPLRDKFETDLDTYTVRLETKREWIEGSSQVYVTDGRIRWHKDHISDGNLASPYGWSKTDWQTWGYRGLYDISLDKFTLSLGFDEMVERGKTRTINEAAGKATWSPGKKQQFLASPYAGARYDFALDDDWTLTPSVGARYHFMSDLHGEWAPSAALAIGRREFGAFASYARAAHYPGLVFRANTTAWRDLRAETMDTFSVGLRGEWEDVASFRLSLFRNSVEDRFDLDERGQYHSAGEMRSHGVEASARATPTDDLSLYAGATWTVAETHPVSRLPEATCVLGASWRFARHLHLDVDAEYSASMYAYTARSENPADLAKVGAFWTVNARLALDLAAFSSQDGEIYLAAENVCNRKYEYFPGYEMPGVMFYVGMKLRF